MKFIGSVVGYIADTLKSIFSASGEISSARVGYYAALFGAIGLACVDLKMNGHLNETVVIAILGAGTGGYGITKASEVSVAKSNSCGSVPSSGSEKQTGEGE